MRVKDLLERLALMDPALEVLAHAQHGECKFQFFDIEAIDLKPAARSRDDIGMPQVRFDDSSARPVAVLTLTSEF